MVDIRTRFLATRPWSFTMTAISVTVGAALAWLRTDLHVGHYLLTLLGAVALHAATNLINDYYDFRSGVDQPESPTVQYRPHPLVAGQISARQTLGSALVAYVVAVVIGLYFMTLPGRVVPLLVIGLVGLAASYLYTGGPMPYKYRALGELSVFLMWGPLMVSGAYLVQTGELSAEAALVSIPFGMLVALVLLANNLRDVRHDKQARITTLSSLLGAKRALELYFALAAVAYLAIILLIGLTVLTYWALLVFVSAPLAWKLAQTMRKAIPSDADAQTAQLDTAFGLLLITALVLERLLPLLPA